MSELKYVGKETVRALGRPDTQEISACRVCGTARS